MPDVLSLPDVDEPGPDVIAAMYAEQDVGDPNGAIYLDLAEPPQFSDNVALALSDFRCQELAGEILDLVEDDVESRKEWLNGYAKGLKTLGFDRKKDTSGSLFSGASTVNHPMIAQACVEFASRAIKELCPPDGSARTRILGKVTPQKRDRAERIRQHICYQQTEQMAPEWREEYERLLMQLPLIGSGFRKNYYDPLLHRPRVEYLDPESVVVPYLASSLATAERVSHKFTTSELNILRQIRQGHYRDIGDISSPADRDRDAVEEVSDDIEGRQPSAQNKDGVRDCYEVQCYLDLPEDPLGGMDMPYLVTIDEYSRNILRIQRNWKEADKHRLKRQWLAHYKFFPWRGFYGIGLIHMIGGLSRSATAALRAQMDIALKAVAGGGFRLKQGRISAGQKTIDPFSFNEIGDGTATDIRQILMPMGQEGLGAMPALNSLLTFLDEKGAGFVSVVGDLASTANSQMPVGTMSMLIEHGSTNYAAVHGRCHAAQAEELKQLCQINAETLDEQETIALFEGEIVISREDYQDTIDVSPVSDPNIFADSQRFAQSQAVLDLIQKFPDLKWDVEGAVKQLLNQLRVPDVDSLLPDPPKPMPVDPVTENVLAYHGKPIQAFPGQDHLACLQVHLAFLTDPYTGGMNLIAAKAAPILIPHILDRIVLWYLETFQSSVSAASQHPVELGEPLPPPLANALADALAKASPLIAKSAAEGLQAVPPIIAKALQTVQQLQAQGAPPDPKAAAITAQTQAKVQSDAAKIQSDQQIANAKLQQEQQADQADVQVKMAEIEQRREEDQLDNSTALRVTAAKILDGHAGPLPNLSSGASLGPGD